MRIRITRRLIGSIDGIQLRQFDPGAIYEVGTVIASYLLANGDAVPVPDDAPLSPGLIEMPRHPRLSADVPRDRNRAALPKALRGPDPQSA